MVLDEVSKNVNFKPIYSIYVTHIITYLNLRTVHRGLAPLGQVKDWPYGSSTLVRLRTVYRGLMLFGQVKDCPSVPWSGSSEASYPWHARLCIGISHGAFSSESVQLGCDMSRDDACHIQLESSQPRTPSPT